ncbi:1-acyl-sn-glycerol-3-phosphate acyltransferase [Ruixingdingia sedimenti]|uniref:Glycerol-3-phosphate acyltransferase n=1 Tax=Ruixingdingia sedimenti TaxID=3073604 RepID=A0ABU1FDQ8_9RHOB|nr:1-acyl-sn-glycerol-3-phosphate acyltransferase [Xinfangfangia sp. LG-4]MDR5655011.1 1-acyl-sn-glycerol-3-phosphate acyltransferase [Xinfangfangia sp. LG-4]
MSGVVAIPVWLLALILAFAAVTFASHFLFPSVRWFLRRRMERAVARINRRLQRPVEPFKLLERHDRVLRLVYDPQVLAAAVRHARDTGMPEEVALQRATRYAREIVPGFSATIYFGIAVRLARWLSRVLYRVQVFSADNPALRGIDPEATVVFVMNHRSNMDYVLVTWLASRRMTLSYAVGEWARVWPLSFLIRAMGAYFIRRRDNDPLYRKVLERYVQMATAEGVAQAIFPEGGLSLDGRVGAPRLGLIGYIHDGFARGGGRDVVFVPVGLSYDRVLEDRLLTEAAATGQRRFRARPWTIARFVGRMAWRGLRGRFGGFGTVGVSFGTPVSLRRLLAEAPGTDVAALADRLMAGVRRVVPVLPVPLVAAAIAGAGPGGLTETALPETLAALRDRLRTQGATLAVGMEDTATLAAAALRPLVSRGIVTRQDGRLLAAPGAGALLAFHAAPVLQHLQEA